MLKQQVVPQLKEDLKRHQADLQEVSRKRAEVTTQLELVQQTVSDACVLVYVTFLYDDPLPNTSF